MVNEFKRDFYLYSTVAEDKPNVFFYLKVSLRILRTFFCDRHVFDGDVADETIKKLAAIADCCNTKEILNFEITEKVIALYKDANALNQNSYEQYEKLKEFLAQNNIVELFPNLMFAMENLLECEELCLPATDYLIDNFGDICIEVLKTLSVDFKNKYVLYEAHSLLSNIISYITVIHTPVDSCVYIEDDNPEENCFEWHEVHVISEEQSHEEEYFVQHQMCCRERLLKPNVFEKLRSIKIMPMYTSCDLDMCECLAGSFVTLKNEENGEVVTYQIGYRENVASLDEIDEMYASIGCGYDGYTANELCDILTHGEAGGCNIPIALHLFRIKEPILQDI